MSVKLPARGTSGTTDPDIRTRAANVAATGTEIQDVCHVDAAGAVLGTSGNPLRTDPTGTTTQPVSATSLGATTDTKVQTDAAGSVCAFLRGIVDWISQVFGSVVQTPTQTKAIRVQIGPGDIISYLPVIVDFAPHQVHEGEAFVFSYLQTAGLNAAATYDVRVSVGALTATTRGHDVDQRRYGGHWIQPQPKRGRRHRDAVRCRRDCVDGQRDRYADLDRIDHRREKLSGRD